MVNKEPHAMCDKQRLSLIRCEVAPLTTSSGFFLLVVSGITSKFARSNQTFFSIEVNGENLVQRKLLVVTGCS